MRYFVLFLQVHLCKCCGKALRLEYGIPSEHVFTAGCHDLAIASPGEDLGLGIFVLTVGYRAQSVGSLVIEASQHIVQTLPTHLFQEALNIGTWETL